MKLKFKPAEIKLVFISPLFLTKNMPLFNSHISYLNKFWQENKYPASFFIYGVLGNMLPDIRYFTKQDRNLTHLKNILNNQDITYSELYNILLDNMDQVLSVGNFDSDKIYYLKKGLAFHIILDIWWPKQLYFPSDFKYFGMCLKFADDFLKNKEIKDNLKNINIQDNVINKISFLQIPQETILKWYRFVFDFINTELTFDNVKNILTKNGVLDGLTAENLIKETEKIMQDNLIIEKLRKIYDEFLWSDIANQKIS